MVAEELHASNQNWKVSRMNMRRLNMTKVANTRFVKLPFINKCDG